MKYQEKSTNRQMPYDDVPTKPRNVGRQVVKRKPSKQNINQSSISKRDDVINIQRDDPGVQSNQLANKINDLERELNKLRETKRQNSSKTHQTNLAEKNSNPLRQSKKWEAQPLGSQGQDKKHNIEINEVLEYISIAMEIFCAFEKQIRSVWKCNQSLKF